MATNTKPRNKLDVRDILRVSLSSIISRWERLVAAKQAQRSHWIKVVITYMSCNKYSLLNICGFLKAGPRKNFSFKAVHSPKKVADPCFKWPHTASSTSICRIIVLFRSKILKFVKHVWSPKTCQSHARVETFSPLPVGTRNNPPLTAGIGEMLPATAPHTQTSKPAREPPNPPRLFTTRARPIPVQSCTCHCVSENH